MSVNDGIRKSDTDGVLGKAYDDLMHLSADEVGRAVHRAVKLTLAPVNGTLWTLEQALAWVTAAAAARLRSRGVPSERIQSPRLEILGNVVAGLQAVGGEPVLSELFANLLGTAMDSEAARSAHPAFGHIIRDLVPDEARVLTVLPTATYGWTVVVQLECRRTLGGPLVITEELNNLAELARCESPAGLLIHLGNLNRLGLIKFESVEVTSKVVRFHRTDFRDGPLGAYVDDARNGVRQAIEALKSHEIVAGQVYQFEEFVWRLKNAALTEFGIQFCQACGVQPFRALTAQHRMQPAALGVIVKRGG